MSDEWSVHGFNNQVIEFRTCHSALIDREDVPELCRKLLETAGYDIDEVDLS